LIYTTIYGLLAVSALFQYIWKPVTSRTDLLFAFHMQQNDGIAILKYIFVKKNTFTCIYRTNWFFIWNIWHYLFYWFLFYLLQYNFTSQKSPTDRIHILRINQDTHGHTQPFKDVMPVSFRSELFTSYIFSILKQQNLLP